MTIPPSSIIRQRTYTIYLPPFLENVVRFCWGYIVPCWRAWWNLPCPDELTQRRISIMMLLACHFVEIEGKIRAAESISTWPAWVALFSFSSVLSRREGAAWATALIMLFALEAIVPVLLVTCTTALVWKQVSWTTGLSIMCALWIGLFTLVRWLRCTLYQNMGHG
jgi:hypothetical protein